jgi:hypothetical protein
MAAPKQKSAEIAPSAFCSVQDLQDDRDAREQEANICLDADGLSRTFLQEIRRLWTAPPHPLRAAFSAPSKTVSGLHGSIGLPSRLQPLQVAPVRPREVVLPWWFEHLAGRSRHGPHRPSFPGFVVTGSSGLEMTHMYRNGRRRTGGVPGLSALSPLSTGCIFEDS